MKISIRKRWRNIRFSLVVRSVINVQAVTSRLDDGHHIIMWDMDGCTEAAVYSALNDIQRQYSLPTIYIAESSRGGGYHAYCLKRCTWLESLAIVASTALIDPAYVSMAAWRKRWTLRLSDKGQGAPEYVAMVLSSVPEDVDPSELTSWTDYEIWAGPKPPGPQERPSDRQTAENGGDNG